jgi:hypothetical protein
MRAKRIRNTLVNEKGQSLVEFALVVPLLLLLVIGIAEFGRAWMTKNIMTGAAREAVRILAVKPPWPGGMTPLNRAKNILNSSNIFTADSNIIIMIDDSTENTPVSVTIQYDFPVLIVGFIPGLNGVTIPLESTTTMRKEY